LNFLNIARASGAEVAYLVQLTYALEIEKLWIEERKAKRVKAARNRVRAKPKA